MIVKEFKKFKVQEDGKIFSNGRELAVTTNSLGYDVVRPRYIYMRVDYIVANSFFPLIDEDGEVIHLDYDLHNHHYTNLQWVSFATNRAIDALTNDCIILCMDNNTSNLISFYRGERHLSIKSLIKIDELKKYLKHPIVPINNKYYFRLKDIEIIEVNTAYMVFIISNKMFVIRYEQKIMYELMKLLKDE
jgi:hypothetical protein